MNQSRVLGRQAKPHNLTDNSLPRNSSNLKITKNNAARTIEEYERQLHALEQQLLIERVRNEQLLSLNEFSRELEGLLDQPVEAQLAASTLNSAFKCNLTLIFVHNPIEQRLVLVASAGTDSTNLSQHYRHSLTRGLVGRAIRARRSLINQDTGEMQEGLDIGDQQYPSQMVVPLTRHGYLEGAILLCDKEPSAFDPEDLPYVEALGSRLVIAWENDRNRLTLAELVESAASLSSTLNTTQLLDRIADIARRSTKANFALVAVNQEDEGWRTGTAGKVPLMYTTTRNGFNQLVDEVFAARATMRVRDIRKDPRTSKFALDAGEFRSMLATPIMIDQQLSGVIMVFGKKTASTFSDQDEFLLNLLGTHAAVSIERCLLDEELRSSLKTTQLLYDLSIRIAETDDLTVAAQVIGRTAYRLFQATSCGLVLYTESNLVEASVLFPADDPHLSHPQDLIQQTIRSRQINYQTISEDESRIAIPIQTPRRCYGALWLELNQSSQVHRPVDEIRILINQASVALERSILLAETRLQANQIAQAFVDLEQSYDQTLLALMNALDARDHETEKHTLRVSQLALAIGKQAGLNKDELKALERGALLHDIGKIGISDNILLKKGKLDPAEWELMQQHPAIGAEIISKVPSLSDALPVIANHHERWDGSGYPNQLVGEEIPFVARIFIVADVLDALTSDRVYRSRISFAEAMQYINEQSGILFDPQVVELLNTVVEQLPETIL